MLISSIGPTELESNVRLIGRTPERFDARHERWRKRDRDGGRLVNDNPLVPTHPIGIKYD